MQRRLTLILITLATITILLAMPVAGHDPRARTAIKFPDILGYKTLKCDLHIHTVFSDGSVWPDIRSEEAWREGLDAIAITDHIEYQPHKDDLPTNHERSYEIAKPHGDSLAITVIRGSEVTRDMPPGHFNAIFLEEVNPLETENWIDAFQRAHDQGAFIFWNHPGWSGQQPDSVARWYPEHTQIYERGFLNGVEVANEREYYPEAHRWCLEKKLTMLGNSDIHNPLNLDYHVHHGDHRPITLVFARENSPDAIKEALFDRRTAVYTGSLLVGEERFLKPLFEQSISVLNPSVEIIGDGSAFVQITNHADVDFELKGTSQFEEIRVPEELILQAGKTVLLSIRGTTEDRTGQQRFTLQYTVENLKVLPDVGMTTELEILVQFTPEPADPE